MVAACGGPCMGKGAWPCVCQVCPRRAPTAGCVQLGFEFREILLIFLAAAAVALAIWYLKNRCDRLEEKLDLLLKEMRKDEKD